MFRKLFLALVAAALVATACSTAPTDAIAPDAATRADEDVPPPPDTTKKCGGMLGSGTVVPC